MIKPVYQPRYNIKMIQTNSYIPPPPLDIDDCSPASMPKRIKVSKKRPLPRKVGRVDFSSSIRVNVLESVNKDERCNIWYTSKDYATFGKDVKTTVKHIRKGRSFNGLTGRGLEKYFSSQYHEEKKRRELSHYRSILVEQKRQQNEGKSNPKLLRMLSTINSKWALQNALELAKHDETEAMHVLGSHLIGTPPAAEDSQGNESDSDLSGSDLSLRDDEIMSTSSF